MSNNQDAGGKTTPVRIARPRKVSERQRLGVQILFVALIFLTARILFGAARREKQKLATPTETDNNVLKRAVNTTSTAVTPTSTGLENVFMVYPPVFGPSGVVDEVISNSGQGTTEVIEPASSTAPSCQVVLMQYDFAYSYGAPFVGEYTPPSCKFNRVIMNFTVEVRGVQYDRLALMYFNDTEVWRTSTAEPTRNGIEWTYIKDMSQYMYFWNSPQKLIFDLGNIYDSTYTGIYNTTLVATFWEGEDTVDPANLIIPISARNGNSNSGSVFAVPSANATNTISFPRNVNRAVFTVASCGQATEEFWWSNVLQSDIDSFEPEEGTLYGYSPFREVQVLLDGKLVGVQWPFPVIFTGGVVPQLWNPIVGIQAFDVLEKEIDITPWLPLLCDGNEHTFTIKVVGIIDDGKTGGVLSDFVGDSWYVTGKIFVWLDSNAAHITTGTTPLALETAPTITTSQKITQDSTGANVTLTYTADVKRTLSISSFVKSEKSSTLQTWSQTLSATNYGAYTNYSYLELNQQSTKGVDVSTGAVPYSTTYSYPLLANISYIVYPNNDFTLEAYISRSIDTTIFGTPVFPTGLQAFSAINSEASLLDGLQGTYLATTQNGSASYIVRNKTSTGFAAGNQVMTFGGADVSNVLDTEFYYRDVVTANRTVVSDEQVLLGKTVDNFGGVENVPEMTVKKNILSPKAAIGRGPGSAQTVLVQGAGSGS